MKVVNQSESFLSNIVHLAREQKIPVMNIAKMAGVESGKLCPANLRKRPFPGLGNMTTEQADALISLVAPELVEELRKLKGYPEMGADNALNDILKELPEQPNSMLANITLGQIFRIHRTRIPHGKYWNIAQCSDGIVNTNELSGFERGINDLPINRVYKLIERFGYESGLEGMKKFLIDTADEIRGYQKRKEEFGRALFIHLYPDGKSKFNSREARAVSQNMIFNAINCSADKVNEIFTSSYVPTGDEVKKIIALFSYNDEQAFYNRADELYRLTPGAQPPVKKSDEGNIVFGKMLKCLREEIGIMQHALGEQVRHERGALAQSYISRLEIGEHIMPVAEDEKIALVKVFGLKDMAGFKEMADLVQMLQTHRAEFFWRCLVKLAAVNEMAGDILDSRYDRVNVFTPALARDALRMLNMTEAEFYRTGGIGEDPEMYSCADRVNEFVEQSPLNRIQKNQRVGKRARAEGNNIEQIVLG